MVTTLDQSTARALANQLRPEINYYSTQRGSYYLADTAHNIIIRLNNGILVISDMINWTITARIPLADPNLIPKIKAAIEKIVSQSQCSTSPQPRP